MGNNTTRVERGAGPNSPTAGGHRSGYSGDPSHRSTANIYASRGNRGSRPDLSFLGLGASNVSPAEYVEARRETKAEREARKLEKERVARLKERERSMKEEHVDGGYLVTQGVYTGTEDFNKAIVRQLMIERRMAPFWRGLDDHSDTWTEYQLVCAARGLPIPAADEIPPEDFIKPPSSSVESKPNASNGNLNTLMVPITSRSQSINSDASTSLSPSHPAFSLPSPTSPTSPNSLTTSAFRPRSKTLASLTTSRNNSQTEMTPREIMLPNDPYVNGQPLEVALYKDAPECVICMMSYPPWLNHTRCCDQPICSECFVQIKRPDPHPPEHEQPDSGNANEPPTSEAEALVSEPACCPYCQQAEFGVTYEPPPFRKGLVYAVAPGQPLMGSVASAMSSSSSINSTGSPPSGQTFATRRRTTSLSANAPTVITTDRIRPDWATKLANARNHAARRAAAATALHTAAYLMGNGQGDQRTFTFTTRSRFSRARGSDSPRETETPNGGTSNGPQEEQSADDNANQNRRRTRIDDLEDMMLMEAIRLSLAAEEERKRKEEKEARKKEKKKEKEAKKAEKAAEKAARKGVYSNGSSASGSALSLSLPVIGRRRGNSASSVLRDNIAEESGKGKAVDRGVGFAAANAIAHATGQNVDFTASSSTANQPRDPKSSTSSLQPQPIPSPVMPTINAPEKPSHLRQMSNVSSGASSSAESTEEIMQQDPRASNSTIASNGEQDESSHTSERERDGNMDRESMFNFSSLAALIGQDDDADDEDGKDAARHVEYLSGGEASSSGSGQANFHILEAAATRSANTTPTQEVSDPMQESMATLKASDYESVEAASLTPDELPEVTITPETPAAETSADEDAKQLGGPTTTVVQQSLAH